MAEYTQNIVILKELNAKLQAPDYEDNHRITRVKNATKQIGENLVAMLHTASLLQQPMTMRDRLARVRATHIPWDVNTELLEHDDLL